jgi:apolipoprotein N-acyltransferase
MGPRVVVMLLSAFLLSTLVAPWGYGFLHWGAYLPVFWALREETPRANRWLAFLYGTVAELLIFLWIAQTIALFSNIPWPLAVGINALFGAVFGLPYLAVWVAVHPLRKRLGDGWIVALPAWLVVVEWLSMNVILFPYNQGISQYRTPYVWQLVSVTGVWGMSYLVLFVNAALAESLYRRREGRGPAWGWAAAAVGALAVTVLFGVWRFGQVEATLAEAPVKRILQVQDDVTMTERLSKPRSEAFDFWMRQTKQVTPGSVDLVVWPEGACPYDLNGSSVALNLWDVVRQGRFDLIVGAGTRERDPDPAAGEAEKVRIFNSVYAFQHERVAVDALRRPSDELAAMLPDCDPDAAHVWLPVEAARLAEEADRADQPACRERLKAREGELRAAGMKVDARFESQIVRDPAAWSRLRAETARFTRAGALALEETSYQQNKSVALWRLREAGCADGDCRGVAVRCEEGAGCLVVPEAPHYDKMVPLPFGEYLPLASTFPWLADLIEGPGNFRAGEEAVVFDLAGTRVATPICYEGILGYVCDRFEAPDLIVNVTNDAWFGDGAASDLHGMLVTARATEMGIPVFRSAYSGISWVTEPHGRIYAETSLFVEENRVVPVRIGRVWTVYGWLGDWFVWFCAALLGALWFKRAA